MFPGKIQPAPHSVCVSAKLKLNSSEKDIFTGFGNPEEVSLEYGRYPVNVVDQKNVKILAKVNAQNLEPLLLKWPHGNGVAYLFVSRCIVKDKQVPSNLQLFLEEKGASKETICAWQCALNVGYKNAIELAIGALGSVEMIGKILLKEYTAIEQFQQVAFQDESYAEHNNEQQYNGQYSQPFAMESTNEQPQ